MRHDLKSNVTASPVPCCCPLRAMPQKCPWALGNTDRFLCSCQQGVFGCFHRVWVAESLGRAPCSHFLLLFTPGLPCSVPTLSPSPWVIVKSSRTAAWVVRKLGGII